MKKLSIALLLFSLVHVNLIAQKGEKSISSGKVVFDISYPDMKLDDQTMASLPSESTMVFDKDMTKVEVSMFMGKTTIISNNKSGNGTMLMDMMGKKWAVEMNKSEIDKQKQEMGKSTVEKTRETKTIAGFNCSKAIVHVKTKDGEMSSDVWYTNELKANNSSYSQIDGIDGFMLEFQTYQNGMGMKMTAKSVEAMEVASSEFEIPDGYEKMTLEDIQKMGTR